MADSQSAVADSPAEIWVAKQLAEVARQFEKHRTGREPESVSVVLADQKLVITVRGLLSSGDAETAKTPVGAAQVRELHHQQFLSCCSPLKQEVEGITGVAVLEATSEVATHTGTVVMVFLLAAAVAASTWTESTGKATLLNPAEDSEEPETGGES